MQCNKDLVSNRYEAWDQIDTCTSTCGKAEGGGANITTQLLRLRLPMPCSPGLCLETSLDARNSHPGLG